MRPRESLRDGQDGSGAAMMAPRCAQDGPRWRQDSPGRPKRTPRIFEAEPNVPRAVRRRHVGYKQKELPKCSLMHSLSCRSFGSAVSTASGKP
eukprot:8463179-Pyramimonas_sp.AAC.1